MYNARLLEFAKQIHELAKQGKTKEIEKLTNKMITGVRNQNRIGWAD